MKPCFKPKFSALSQDLGQSKANESRPANTKTVLTDQTHNGLSEKEYEEIFASVLARAAAGNLTGPKQRKPSSPTHAAGNFTERVQNLSPLTVQAVNEVTPNTSPPDEVGKPQKQILLKPTKDKPRKQSDTFRKRKSLEYKSSGNFRKEEKQKLKECKHLLQKPTVEKKPKKKYLLMGIWVQCGSRDCLKWRFLPDCVDPCELPERWTCSLNTDPKQNHCSAPEIDWTSCINDSQDHFVYTEYNAGSIVWAKMPGYPPWPAMVDSDPDYNMFYEYDEHGMVLRYHVVFLDDNVSRAWIPARYIGSYTKNPFKNKSVREYREELQSAVSVADSAVHMTVEKRLKKFGFEARFNAANNRSGGWTPKKRTSNKKSKTHHCKAPKENDHVVPDISSNLGKTVTKNSDADMDNYWKHATEDDMEVPVLQNKSPEPITDKPNDDGKSTINDKECTDHSNHTISKEGLHSNATPVPKPRKKPCFVAPSRSATQQSQNTVPPKNAALILEEKLTIQRETEKTRKLSLDSEIFTMELSGSPEKPKDYVGSPILCGSLEDQPSDNDEPIDLSSKSGNQNHSSQNTKNSNMSGKDFWVLPPNKKDCGDISDDPFLSGNLEDLQHNLADERSDLLDDFDDCKLQQLDEWMPAIAD